MPGLMIPAPGVRVSPVQPIKLKDLGKCPICGYRLVENLWLDEGRRIDHDLPKTDFPTLESAVAFLRKHP